MKHVMIDLETLDTVATAKTLSIGAVAFDETGCVHRKVLINLDLDSQKSRTMSGSTFDWWLGQSSEARAAITGAERKLDLKSALKVLSGFMEGTAYKVWSNGAAFDIPILDHAYRELGIETPWKFGNVRCYRTIKAMHREVNVERTGTAHNALDDAMYQMQVLVAIHKAKGGIL